MSNLSKKLFIVNVLTILYAYLQILQVFNLIPMLLMLARRRAISQFHKLAFCSTLLSFYFAIFAEPQATKAASLEVVAEGLDNVRGLSFAPDGSLYITEAGVGGDGPCVPALSLQNLPACVGTSGAVTRVYNGKQERILTGLPSIALSPTGAEASGPQDIQFDAAGKPYLLIGYAATIEQSNKSLTSFGWGQLYKVDLNTGSLTSLADFSSYESTNNPDRGYVPDLGGLINSNPFALAVSGDTVYVTDAAGNDLLSVGLDGSNLTTVAVLPKQTIINPIFPPPEQVLLPNTPPPGEAPKEIEIESVPTGVAVGPDKALYVSELTGFPVPVGAAKIYRVGADGEITVYADGFTQLIDLAFDTFGNLYVLQYANEPYWNGNLDSSVVQIAPDGTRTTLASGNGLEAATALTVGPDGAIYISNKGDRAGVGEVVRLSKTEAGAEPSSALNVLAFGALDITSFLKTSPLEVVKK